MKNIEGILPHHEVECPFCLDYVQWCENCGDQEPCEECLSECPCCGGTQVFRWGSYYSQDVGKCDACRRGNIPIMSQETDSMLEEWICFDCYVLSHSLTCPDCSLWEKWEFLEQLFYQIEGPLLDPLQIMKGFGQVKKSLASIPIIERLVFSLEGSEKALKKVRGRIDKLLSKLEENPKRASELDLPLMAYLFCMSGEPQKEAAEFLFKSLTKGSKTSWTHKLIQEILAR